MTVALHERGAFTWKEWAVTARRGDHRGAATSRRSIAARIIIGIGSLALERIVERKGLVTGASLRQRRLAWDEAARHTPHGQPIELDR